MFRMIFIIFRRVPPACLQVKSVFIKRGLWGELIKESTMYLKLSKRQLQIITFKII
jgi:hypothetical protein